MAKETDTLLDHDYDGIQEYDNPLPGWWLWLFYGTILFSIFYVPYYLMGWGPTMAESYQEEVSMAPKPQAAQPPAEGGQPSGGAPAMASLEGNPEAIAAGNALYTTNCVPCHGDKGQGLIGPNLTDNYWLHGNTYNDLVQVISNGVPDKGMIPWKTTMNPTKIAQVAAYVMTLRGTNPPNPKAPQGKEYPQ